MVEAFVKLTLTSLSLYVDLSPDNMVTLQLAELEYQWVHPGKFKHKCVQTFKLQTMNVLLGID